MAVRLKVRFALNNKHKIVAALAGSILLIALGVVVSFAAFSQIEKAAEARKHARVVIISADNLLSELINAETGRNLSGTVPGGAR